MSKFSLLFLIPMNTFLLASAQSSFVPDSATAVKIAEAVWIPIFGNDIYKERPFIAKLIGDSVWIVTGTKSESGWNLINGHKMLTVVSGGVLHAEIAKKDGSIITVFHSK